MKKVTKIIFVLLTSCILFSCSYDDSDLWKAVNKLRTDVSSLNNQVTSLKTIVDALNSGKVITELKPLSDNKGYAITFNDGTSIEILNGKTAPTLGVDEENGTYYWTITTEGETNFLLDSKKNKIPVSGKDGNTPTVSIDAEGFWTVNNTRILDANSNPIKAQGDSFFTDITEKDNNVIFTFANGNKLTVPKGGNTFLRFENEKNEDLIVFNPGEKKRLKINFANIKDLEILSLPQGWKANLHKPDKYVEITAPEDAKFGIEKLIISGLDKNGLVYQAIVKISVASNVFSADLGVFILNEGNMTTENGSLLFIAPDGQFFDKAYYSTNGTELGNVTQDLFIKGDKMYIISQNGNKNGTLNNDGMLVVLNSQTLKKETSYNDELSVLSWPSHIAVLDEENIFIRDNKGIYLFNSKTKELTFVEGSQKADKLTMAVTENKVFAASRSSILVLEANKTSVSHVIDMTDRISGVIKSKDGNLWVSTTGKPNNKISKIDSKNYAIIKTNEITDAKLGKGWGSTPGITAKGDTIYFSNATTKIYRHIFSKEETTLMVDAKTMVENASIVYNNIAVHPITGKVYMNTIKGYGWDFLTNNISEFDFSGPTPVLSANYTNYTHFPAGIFFTANYK